MDRTGLNSKFRAIAARVIPPRETVQVDQRLRLLAHWHARRRQVDELMTPLLACGPAAVERVYARLPELTQAMRAEREAFEAFATATDLGPAQRSGGQLGCSVPVDELARARRRATTR